VLGGHPFVGRSRPALRLLWGAPSQRQGPAPYERWSDDGVSFSLAAPGSYSQRQAATVIEVALETGKMAWWAERVPAERPRSLLRRRFRNTPADETDN
jgi:hypothetical protein